MTIYSREVIDDEEMGCSLCKAIGTCSDTKVVFKGRKTFPSDNYYLTKPVEIVINRINYCPKCGGKL